VIHYLFHEGHSAAEIYRQIALAYGENAMNRQNVTKWVRQFKEERTNVLDEERSGRPSLVTEEFLEKVDSFVRSDRHLTLKELHQMCSEVSRTVLYETITDRLDFQKLCARWIPKMLTDQHKTSRIESGWAIILRFEKEEEFLDLIVTGDETCVLHNTPETKRQSMQ